MLLAGRLAHHRFTVPGAVAFFGLAGMLPALAHSFGALFGLLLVLGAATGALDVSINARASRLEGVRGVRVLDGIHAGFSAGVLVGGVGAGLLRKAGVPPSAILIGVGGFLLAIAVANLFADALPAARPGRARLGRPLLVIGLVLAVAFLVENGLETWSALFLERGLGSSPAVSGLGPGLFAAAMATGRLLAQRAEHSSVVGRMALAGITAAGGLGLAAVAQHPAVALTGFVIAGGGLALSAPTLFRLAGTVGGGPAISTVAMLGYLGFLGGPPLFGAVAGLTSLRGAFVFLGAAALLLVACAPVLRRFVGEIRA
jgi:hypothetical protein